MADLIQLLPNHIANQIAAGEVVQRPSNAVKELLENAVDAGATEIKLFVEDAGKALIQVIDNGKGMNERDARNSFERHATSKIRQIEDLFKIKTMGFRGEALASIASVAQVVMRTRTAESELGTEIEIENSKVLRQEPCACSVGTSISMKNLFFNVPARRNFLKSNTVELKNILDEFIHVSLAHPDLFFSYTNNGQEMYHLESGTLKQRIVQLMGNSFASKLVSVEEQTDYLNIQGFIGKPETAKKTRGDQYLFVNNRFIKSSYLTHAIVSSFEAMIPEKSFPFFAIFLELDPSKFDVNVHPTKQEIKFEDEKIVYAFIKSAIRHSLAQFSIAPAIDFELDPGIQRLDAISKPFSETKQESTKSGGLYKSFVAQHQAHRIETKSNLSNWRDFFETKENPKEIVQTSIENEPQMQISTSKSSYAIQPLDPNAILQVYNTYILYESVNGIAIVHQQLAHQQILFCKFNDTWGSKSIPVQQNLFPVALNLSPGDAALLNEIMPDLLHMGYQLEPFGQNSYLLQGSPSDYNSENDQSVIEMILENVKDGVSGLHKSYRERIAKTLAKKHAIKSGSKLHSDEMRLIIEQLQELPQYTTHFEGKSIFLEVKKDYLANVFGL